MKVKIEEIGARPGWASTSAVRNRHVYEIPSDYILQPGPASLTEGVRHLHSILAHVTGVDVSSLTSEEALDRTVL
jgi:iron complex transport system substrate-binding protein